MRAEQVTARMVVTFEDAAVGSQDVRASIAAVLSLPEVRQAIHDDVEQDRDMRQSTNEDGEL